VACQIHSVSNIESKGLIGLWQNAICTTHINIFIAAILFLSKDERINGTIPTEIGLLLLNLGKPDV
jgi:hypothetical protein